MGKGEYLGEFEMVVLVTALRLGEEAYGMRIRQEIDQRGGRSVSIGAIYGTLERLARKGYVAYEMGDPTPSRGGRAKRFVKVTPTGLAALSRSRELLAKLWDGVSEVSAP